MIVDTVVLFFLLEMELVAGAGSASCAAPVPS